MNSSGRINLSIFLVFLTSAVFAGVGAQSAETLCNDTTLAPAVCGRMKNLRSHIMMLESQRDLMQVNYSYMSDVAQSLAKNSTNVISELPVELIGHANALKAVSTQASEVAQLAKDKNSQAFISANSLRNNCAACHASDGGVTGRTWNEIFKMDWMKIVEKCNSPGRNPYTCKQMHGLVTNYSYVLTAYNAKIDDFAMFQSTANEMNRITQLIEGENMIHGGAEALAAMKARTEEVIELARARDPRTFAVANSVVDSCMTCHDAGGDGLMNRNLGIRFSVWR